MKTFFTKFLNPIFKNKFSQINSIRKFSTFQFEIKDGRVNPTEKNYSVNLNWQLAKVWVTPQNNCYLNTLTSKQNFGESNEECQVSGEVKPLEFDRFVRKYGLTISREENVYVQDGIYKSKKIRLITSDNKDAEFFSQIFEEKLTENDNPDLHVLLLTNHPQIVSKKRFVYSSKIRKILLSNSMNLENIKKGIELI